VFAVAKLGSISGRRRRRGDAGGRGNAALLEVGVGGVSVRQ